MTWLARPKRVGLDYFPHSCIAGQELQLLQAEYGLKGYAVVMKLYEMIFFDKGYFCEWTKDVAMMFAHRNAVSISAVSEIVACAVRRGIFDKDMYEKYGILTSAEIQEEYLEIVSRLRRKYVTLTKEYLMTDCTLFSVSVRIYSINSGETQINSVETPQKKTNEKKGKETTDRKKISYDIEAFKKYDIFE